MSLQVWLPLNGNLNNNGISKLTIYDSNATYKTGKLGKGLNLSTTVGFGAPGIVGAEEFTVAFWSYCDTDTSKTSDWVRLCLLNAAKSDNSKGSSFRFETCYSSSLRSRGVSWHNNGNNTIVVGSVLIGGKDEWHHICVTVKPGQVKTYDNGTLVNTNTNTLGGHLTGDVRLGTDVTGCMNDFRLYDHCLSPREVKEISKGLVLHYPLNQPERSPNLSTLISDIPDLPYGAGDSVYSLSTDGVSRRMTCTKVGSAGRYNYCFPNEAREANTTYTWSVDIRANRPISNVTVGLERGGEKVFNIDTNWQRISKVAVLSTSGHSAFVVFPYSNAAVGDWIEIKNFKVEKGSVATPWSPATADYPTWSDWIEYDTSGLNNNGHVFKIVSVVGNSPRNKIAYKFPTDAYISCGNTAKVTDEITVNIWAYMSTWNNNIRLVSCTENAGWCFESYNNKISFTLYVKDVGYKRAISSTLWSELSSGWHMFTGTYDGFTVKLYVDGNLHASTSNGQSVKTPIYYISNGLFIHAESSYTENSLGIGYAEMDMSDFRIYATALSAEDIKELYNAPVAITNNGVLMTQGEVVEE